MDPKVDPQVQELEIYAWVGRDELAPAGEGEVGIKQGFVPAGLIPLVSIHREKMEPLAKQMQAQSNAYGRTIRLCRFKFVEEVVTLEPRDRNAVSNN